MKPSIVWPRLVLRVALGLLALAVVAIPRSAHADRLRDVADVLGARDNQLIGYGVVTGLNGTGDDASAPFAAQSLRALLRRLGVQVDDRQVRLRNVAAVVVTATIPPFLRSGSRIDVTVSSIGNARSLQGGVLLQTPLRGADRRTYAVAQGPLVLGGFSVGGRSGSSLSENAASTARIPSGALVEREIPTTFAVDGKVTLVLRSPDFATAENVARVVNEALGEGSARALDGAAIEVRAPAELRGRPVALVSRLGELEVQPATPARVVINERTGTIVAGGDVRLAPVAIAQGGITIAIRESPAVSQPGVLSGGSTEVVPNTEIDVAEKTPPALTYLNGATTLADVAQALSTFGVTPRELASILSALKGAGALRAEVVIQ
ncbi:MAG TPA: flagellar basal body P-ring protein FlgI [Polyangiaceae bacterium]|nr:flagellar basal body P-ring protein FlgI [Polyangiaceae bacterium]